MKNLQLLRDARNQYEKQSTQEAFEAYFIGVLSGAVDEETWKNCIEQAKDYAARVKAA